MNRRKFLGTVALAPLEFAFKNPFSGLFKWFFEPKCDHKDPVTGKPTWVYFSSPDNKITGTKICMRCLKHEKTGWVSYRVKFTTTLPPNTVMRIRHIDG